MIDALRCPLDWVPLTRVDRRVACPNGHSFDIARQGYVNLVPANGKRSKMRSDDAEMVIARERFLATGAYDPILQTVAKYTATNIGDNPTLVAEVGAGTAAYLGRALNGLPTARGLAMDLSVPATIRAARSHDRVSAIVADSWQPLPIADHSCDAVIVAFAPRTLAELHRILRPNGHLVLASAYPGHLAELTDEFDLLGVTTKNTQRDAAAADRFGFELIGETELGFSMNLDRSAVFDLIGMGPNAWHIDRERVTTQLAQGPAKREVTAAVGVRLFARR